VVEEGWNFFYSTVVCSTFGIDFAAWDENDGACCLAEEDV
jgi:hypothetical protein